MNQISHIFALDITELLNSFLETPHTQQRLMCGQWVHFKDSKCLTNLIGCVIGELLLNEPLFPGDSNSDQLLEIIKVLGTPTNEQVRSMNPTMKEFIFPHIQPYPWRKVI